jgi:hypothetical protein
MRVPSYSLIIEPAVTVTSVCYSSLQSCYHERGRRKQYECSDVRDASVSLATETVDRVTVQAHAVARELRTGRRGHPSGELNLAVHMRLARNPFRIYCLWYAEHGKGLDSFFTVGICCLIRYPPKSHEDSS